MAIKASSNADSDSTDTNAIDVGDFKGMSLGVDSNKLKMKQSTIEEDALRSSLPASDAQQ